MRIYNTLTRKTEEFKPLNPPHVGMYSCGPTVYDYQHIGHMRRYVGDDILVRVLKFNNFNVKQIMNITDVGHLTSDEDTGEDKMEKGAAQYKLSVWDLAKKFEKQFIESTNALNIVPPTKLIRATETIQDQLDLIKILEEKGFTYTISDGVYFDTSKFKKYGAFGASEIKEGARVEKNPEKKNARDFALWKFSPEGEKRQMEWDSPWGRGFPGWHVECSAMSMKELGPTFDIHTGGIDHIPIHHTNEIAQSEAASGKTFVKYWVHHAFLLVDGQKMSKSLGNFYTVEDIKKNGFDPMALRYLYLQTHYRQEMNFTWDSLKAAENAFEKLKNDIQNLDTPKVGCAEFEQKFQDAINNDLNMPEALAVVWELVRSDYPGSAKAESLKKFDDVLGLKLFESVHKEEAEIPEEVQKLVKEREELRREKRFHLSDQLRNKIEKMGYILHDIEDGETKVEKNK